MKLIVQPQPQVKEWFRPVPYSDDWNTHGNSIGNGAIIKVLPPSKNYKKVRVYERPTSAYVPPPTIKAKQKSYKLLPDPVQLIKAQLVEPMNARPFSPISYDFRGRRIKDKDADQSKSSIGART